MHDPNEAALDDGMRAALARLTENEKSCLRRRLRPQTAKEMALELGVSPHAIEKRLKMARAKLGVSSSLQAARLLALAEDGYQRTGPSPSDLAAPGDVPHPFPHGDAPAPAKGRSRRATYMIWGMTMISILLASTIALGLTSTAQDAPNGTNPKIRASLATEFQRLDRDRSGYLDAQEIPRGQSGQHGDLFMAQYDSDRDGKVSQTEFLDNTRHVFQLQAVPAAAGAN
jgi:DNA-binding CsgD family transcriptional regulator